MWRLLKQDAQIDVNVGDKVYLKTGDLKGTVGKIINIGNNQQIVEIKPLNIDGFDENLEIEKIQCVRYFDQGDQIRVLEGKYKGLSGIVTSVDL